jgi:hypothetical protein
MDAAAEVIIFRPRTDVARFLMDPRNDSLWATGIESAKPLEPGPLRAGSRVHQVTKAFGVRTTVTYEITSIVPGEHLELRIDDPFEMWVLYVLDDTPGGTRVSVRTKAVDDEYGFVQRFGRWFTFLARWNLRRDMRRLKRFLEMNTV